MNIIFILLKRNTPNTILRLGLYLLVYGLLLLSLACLFVRTCILLCILQVGRPQRQVIPQQLHDQRAVLIRIFAQSVQFGDSIVKGLFGEMARLFRRRHDFIVEYGEIKRKT